MSRQEHEEVPESPKLTVSTITDISKPQIKVFALMRNANIGELRALGKSCYQSGNIPAALRSFDHVFDKTPILHGITHPAPTPSLLLFSDFMHLFDGFRLLVSNPEHKNNIHQLFGLHSTSTGSIAIPKDNLILGNVVTTSEQPHTAISKTEFHDLYNESLWSRLTDRLNNLVQSGLAEGKARIRLGYYQQVDLHVLQGPEIDWPVS